MDMVFWQQIKTFSPSCGMTGQAQHDKNHVLPVWREERKVDEVLDVVMYVYRSTSMYSVSLEEIL
jgi:hypothetical protein